MIEVWRCRERPPARWPWSYFATDECDPEPGDEPGYWISEDEQQTRLVMDAEWKDADDALQRILVLTADENLSCAQILEEIAQVCMRVIPP